MGEILGPVPITDEEEGEAGDARVLPLVQVDHGGVDVDRNGGRS